MQELAGMTDWIDEEYARRCAGQKRALSQTAHAAVNARYPGCTLERCVECDEETGRAGPGDDSLYGDDGSGPFCEECHDEKWRQDIGED